MAKTVFALTERDAVALRAMISEFQRRSRSRVNTLGQELVADMHQAPEVYVARVPSSGIPALTWEAGAGILDTPGSTTCALYKLHRGGPLTGQLVPIQVNAAVHNLSTDAVPADTWCLVERDKFGTWWVSGSGGLTSQGDTGDTGTSPGGGGATPIRIITCVSLITPTTDTGTGVA